MYQLVGMESQTIKEKMKCLMYIALIQSLLGKILLYESVYIAYKYEVFEYNVLRNNFFHSVLRVIILPVSTQNYTLKYSIKIILN